MSDPEVREIASTVPFEAPLERLSAAITKAGLIPHHRIDHQAAAREAGLEMPPAIVLAYGHPKSGTPIMLAVPWAALDLPPPVLLRVRDDGKTAIAFHPIGALHCRAGVPASLAERLNPAQQVFAQAVLS